MIRLAVYNDIFGDEVDTQIKALKENEINVVELKTINNKSISLLSEDEIINFAVKFLDAQIYILSLHSDIGIQDLSENYETELDNLAKLLKVAVRLDIKNIFIHTYLKKECNRSKIFERLSSFVELSRKYNVDLVFENEQNYYSDTLENILDLIRNIDGIKYAYNPSNFLLCHSNSYNTISALSSITSIYHLNDLIKDKMSYVALNEGDFNLELLIKSADRDSFFSFEYPSIYSDLVLESIKNLRRKYSGWFLN